MLTLSQLTIAPEPPFDPVRRAVLRDRVIEAARNWKAMRGESQDIRQNARLNLIEALNALDAAQARGGEDRAATVAEKIAIEGIR